MFRSGQEVNKNLLFSDGFQSKSLTPKATTKGLNPYGFQRFQGGQNKVQICLHLSPKFRLLCCQFINRRSCQRLIQKLGKALVKQHTLPSLQWPTKKPSTSNYQFISGQQSLTSFFSIKNTNGFHCDV